MATATHVGGNQWMVHLEGRSFPTAVAPGQGATEAIAAVQATRATPSVAVQLARTKRTALRVAADEITAAGESIIDQAGPRSEIERWSWSRQDEAARTYDTEGDSADSRHLQMLDLLRSRSTRTRLEQAQLILGRADAYALAAANMISLREQCEQAIADATNEGEVQMALIALKAGLAA